MKNWTFILIIFNLNWGYTSETPNWDERFNNLCSYDASFCESLKSSDGKWKQPKKEMVMALKVLSPSINKASKDFGVDPRAIAGSILAENSLNVSISDDIQDWLVKMKIAGDGDLLGKQFSFGWGQLYMDAAMEAEPLMASIERRKLRSPEEVAEALLKPEESIRYVAAVVKTIQENYKKEGFDISNQPEILTTLYNLGGSGKRARETKELERKPRVNYFGFFVEKNIEVIDGIVNPEINETKLANQEFWDVDKPQGRVESFLALFRKDDKRPKEKARRATEEIILVHAPPLCNLGGNEDDREYIQNASFSHSKPSGTIQFKEGFREISTYLDCDLTEWRFIEGEDGTRKGWVSLNTIEEKSRPSDILKLCEANSNINQCLESLKKIKNLTILASTDGTDSAVISLYGKKEKINWKRPFRGDWCDEQAKHESEYQDKNPSSRKPFGEKEIKKLKEGIKQFQNNVGKIIDENYSEENGDYCFNCMDNPFSILRGKLNFWKLESCSLETDNSHGKIRCSGSVDLFLRKLKNIKIKKKPTWSELKDTLKYTMGMTDIITEIYDNPSSANVDIEEILKGIKEKLQFCLDMAKDYPESRKLLQGKLKELHNPLNEMKYLNNQYLFGALKQHCASLKTLYVDEKEEIKVDEDCYDCVPNINIFLPFSGPNNSSSESMSLALIKSMLTSKDEKDKFLVDQVELGLIDLDRNNQNYGNVQNSTLEADACSYDPEETAKIITEIGKLDCVQEVYVPDPYLLNYFSRIKGSKVPFIKGFIENDRFEIDIKKRNICIE